VYDVRGRWRCYYEKQKKKIVSTCRAYTVRRRSARFCRQNRCRSRPPVLEFLPLFIDYGNGSFPQSFSSTRSRIYIYIYIYPTVAGEHRGTAGNSGDEEQGRRRWEDLRKTNLALSSPPRHPSPTPGRAHNTYVSVARTSTAEPRACAATTIN